MSKSKIEWTESTWNPITGCTKISEGCQHCYAEKMAKRLRAMGQLKYKNGFDITLHPECLDDPSKLKKPQMIFVCSMSDIFHEKISLHYIYKIFKVMNKNQQHTFQVLTKRPERIDYISSAVEWTGNIWLGVTIENNKHLDRLGLLLQSKAKVKYLSLEPLLSEIDIPEDKIKGIDWVIVGGESGVGARPIKVEWVRKIRDVCQINNIPFFFKQWGGVHKKENGNLLDGKVYQEMPKFDILK